LKLAEHGVYDHAGVVAEVATGLADQVNLNGIQHGFILGARLNLFSAYPEED
jgi:hypothetical protein